MIEIEGRVLAGLDEFMLRIGHLLLLCRVAHEVGGSWPRIHREAADRLSLPVIVSPENNQEVAAYLVAKGLCRSVGISETETPTGRDYLYPGLEAYLGPSGNLLVRTTTPGGPVTVHWQDRNLADARVRSRVGALTWLAKWGSKTGLSHVCDWAQFLDLIDSAGQLSPMGRLLVSLTGFDHIPFSEWNPYLPGRERVILAYEYLRKDLDLFARYAPMILRAPAPLSKAMCRKLFGEALRSAAADADASRTLPSRARFELFQQINDLERSARKARTEIEETSTAWHRAASRVEMLTDFGLLEKGQQDVDEKYKYIYFPTNQLALAVGTLEAAQTGDDWIDHHLVAIILGPPPDDASHTSEISDKQLLSNLGRIVHALKLPTTQVPIECLLLGLTYLTYGDSAYLSFFEIRRALEGLPGKYPHIARLARGREGTRAEYLSINPRNLPEP